MKWLMIGRFKNKKIPDHIWSFIKTNKFLGMIIPKEFGGLGIRYWA